VNLEQGKNTNLKVLSASGHQVPKDSLFRLGNSLAKAASNFQTTISSIAIGDNSLGDEGVLSFCNGIQKGSGRTTFEQIDLSWKGLYV
jgi:hypothetical protein